MKCVKINCFCLCVTLGILFYSCSNKLKTDENNYKPSSGYVPDKETAIKIAEAVWLPVYGKKIYESTPFVAELKNGIWIVKGTVHYSFGGAPYLEIRREDCKIIKMYHEK